MADNTQLNVNTSATGATNVTIAADEIAGVLHQRVKISVGDDGSAADMGPSNPLYATISGAIPAGGNAIGSVTVSNAVALAAGTNLVGKIGLQAGGADVTAGAGAVGPSTQRMTLASDDPAVAALVTMRDATNTINVAQDTSTVKNGATSLTPKFATIAASSSGNNTLVAAVTGKKIRVLAYNFISNGTVNGKFQSGAGGTDLTGLKYCVANSGICAPFNPVGWFETASATLLNLNLSGAVAVGGELVYVEV